MAITYGFFNSISGDRVYDADQMSEYYEGLVSDGIYESVGSRFQVTAGEGMTVNVGTGRAIIKSKWLKNDAIFTAEITESSVMLNRYTAVVLRLDTSERTMTITTKDGEAASQPSKPDISSSGTIIEMCLAYIFVPKGSTSINQANIQDMRGSSLCPWVTGIVKQADTSGLFDQFAAWMEQQTIAFQAWFNSLTSQLNVNTYMTKYTKVVNLAPTDSRTITLDMAGYTYEASDLIMVYINGLLGVEDTDYTTAQGSVTLNLAGIAGQTENIQILVMKSKIGDPSGGGSSVHQTTITNSISSESATRAQQTQLDYYLKDGLIGSGSARQYVTCNLDKTMTNGSYIVFIKDGATYHDTQFEWNGNDVVITSIYGFTLTITSATAGLTDYSGAWRDIYCDIYKL